MFVTQNPFVLDVRTLVYLESCGSEFAKSALLEPLMKSKQRTGLVQVERTVTKKGTTFIQKFWTRPDRVQKTDIILQGQKNLDAYNKRIEQTKEQHQFVKLDEDEDAWEYFGMDESDDELPYGQWSPTLSTDERNSIRRYTGHLYKRINSLLRGTPMEFTSVEKIQKTKEIIHHIEKALDRFELRDGLVVHRLMNPKSISLFKEGEIWQDEGFTSTTPIQGSYGSMEYDPEEGVNIVIRVPPGKGHGAWVSPISPLPHENEFLLNRGTRFKINKITKVGSGYRIEMDVVDHIHKDISDLRPSFAFKSINLSKNGDKWIWMTGDIKKVES